ncbi:sulfurtransferase [Adonisia turfae]|uniref:thiosulfate sulfurtransferase n=1 Tax=Adonisia turfae CCMR0081 TaxID=2292702 RepID=A0A6M0RTM6_9CYAN|nr:sulfurtransferase [Adonisia turfae]NEZ59041.1 sulfurtransferase [Adonisia turfae CCMR0081]
MTDYACPDTLVDTQWLADHLDDPNVRIVELAMGPDLLENAHIPGAVFWSIFPDLSQPDMSIQLDQETIENVLSRSGISPETTVVAYGSDIAIGGVVFWLLTLFGHENVKVLNGGHQKWTAESRPVTTEFSTFAPTRYQAKPLNSKLRVLQAEVETSLKEPDQVLLDVRTPEEYRGEIFIMKPPEGQERAGHIPGAVHVEHTDTVNDDGTFKSFNDLKHLYSQRGITPDKEVFPYCAIGGRSAFIWFVLTYLLGYPNVRNYDGSWNQWSRLPGMPTEP